jgi:lysophospholipase L1-like esterase
VTKRCFKGCLLVANLLLASTGIVAADFQLASGDRVVFLGGTLIERAQHNDYLEACLTAHFHHADIRFRNLAWSGDTVFGDARAGFDTATQGYERLLTAVRELKPTLLLIAYGTNESFAGTAGLAPFEAGLNRLLDDLADTRARVVLLSPLSQENLGSPLPDPRQRNQQLRPYAAAIAQIAAARGHHYIDLGTLLIPVDGSPASPPLTDNGMHLTPWGYWQLAASLAAELGCLPPSWRLDVDRAGGRLMAEGLTLSQLSSTADQFTFTATDQQLPLAPAPPGAPAARSTARVLRVAGLAPGRYTLRIDDQTILTASAGEWARGIELTTGPQFDQAERLRHTVVAKNQLYFHRWRPQNETYLFGFRKHEQGQNAAEVPQFDPLVAQRETEIAALRVPASHVYQLTLVP